MIAVSVLLNISGQQLFFYTALVISGSAIAFGFDTLFYHPHPLDHHLFALVLIWAGFFGVCFLCKTTAFGKNFIHHNSTGPVFWFWLAAFGFGVLFRGQVLLAEPYLADDYQRYLFDGRLILSGFNPYAVTPLDFPELGGSDIPKPDIKTIYPPLAEGLFAVAALLGGSLWHWRALNLIPDILGAAVFARLLHSYQRPRFWLILWLWNPLILKEGLHAAHLDIWTLLAVLLFVDLAGRNDLKRAAICLGAAVLLKLIPVLLLPAWMIQLSSRRHRLIATGIVCGVTLIGFSFFLPSHPFDSIILFLQSIQGYGVLFQFVRQGFESLHLGGDLNAEWSKWLLTSLGGALYLHRVFILRIYSCRPVLHLLDIFLLFYLFSSMGFPWYLLPVVPWLLIYGHSSWLLLIALSQLVFYAAQLNTDTAPLTALAFVVLLIAAWQQKRHGGAERVGNYA